MFSEAHFMEFNELMSVQNTSVYFSLLFSSSILSTMSFESIPNLEPQKESSPTDVIKIFFSSSEAKTFPGTPR
jgi:hypothetical protein